MSDPITAMAVGAALGGGTSAIKGGNVFKGALLGGALGGAGSGLMGAMGSGAAAAPATGAVGTTAGEIGGLNLIGPGVANATTGVGTAATQVMPSIYTTPSVYGGGAASSMLDKTGAFIRDIPSNLYESAKANPFQTVSNVSNMIPTQQQQRQIDTSVPPLLRSINAGELTYGISPEQRELEKIIKVQQQRGTFPYNILGQ
tara:strand:- start:3067 stop:3669 length:603 start_codon:yes stop_codon:yes gene_type:complete